MTETLAENFGVSPVFVTMAWLLLTLGIGVAGALFANELGFKLGRRIHRTAPKVDPGSAGKDPSENHSGVAHPKGVAEQKLPAKQNAGTPTSAPVSDAGMYATFEPGATLASNTVTDPGENKDGRV
ncbi:hypothetical protein [Roseibium sp. SCP14]|uniref:hypothetical protein n=1 Tax=Roseibium sp. SCP14 TaxID=3141375 RepID=UPI0033368519